MTDYVRVKTSMPPGHIRTPAYLRGKVGLVERTLGAMRNPETAAYGHVTDKIECVRVRFTMQEVWGDKCEAPLDTLDAEIYTHWLEPADAP